MQKIRREVHYEGRIVPSFAERPADLDSTPQACVLQPPRMVSARSVPSLAFGRWLRSGTCARPLRAPCFKGIKRSRRASKRPRDGRYAHRLSADLFGSARRLRFA